MEYRVLRSFRKTLSLEVLDTGEVVVRCPYFLSGSRIAKIVDSKRDWIEKKQALIKLNSSPCVISRKDAEELRARAKSYILPRIQYWSEKTGLAFNGVKITSARSRFGSCNSKGNICFSLFLMLFDYEEIDYVILHELCHIKHMNHSEEFYRLIQEYMPDYKTRQKKLKNVKIPVIINEKG